MIFNLNNVKNLPVAIIDNFYSNEELKLIYQELFFLNNELSKMYPPLITGSAQEDSGQYLKNNMLYSFSISVFNF